MWTIPPRTPGIVHGSLPSSFVYSIPAYPIYKTYPFTIRQEASGIHGLAFEAGPEITFDPTKLRSESGGPLRASWFRRSSVGFESVEKFRTADWYDSVNIP
jgi:hypothetical protein